ncbi:hypothetical protein AB0G42_19505 [Streptomyces yangpuensis]|uniref:hypothetical protein n=1 Tax=Streptomyces yangpuensis TaxID=1648182 RepID=UPI00344A9217
MGLIAPSPTVGRTRPDAPVLGSRPLRRGVSRSKTSRFEDDIWDLTPAVLQDHVKAVTLRWSTIPAAFRLVTKELLFALLAHKPPPGQPGLSISSIRMKFSEVKGFLTWAEKEGIASISEITPQLLARYNTALIAAGGTVDRRDRKRRAARLFWIYREALPADGRLSLDPPLIEGWHEGGTGRRGRDNSTPRIPEPVMGPLLVWSLRFVNDFADDILAAMAEWTALHTRSRRGSGEGRGARDRLALLLDRYRAAGRPLPGGSAGHRGINMRHLAREIDCSQRTVTEPAARQLVEAAADQVGVADGTYLWTGFEGRLDGLPWQEQVPVTELPNLVRLLHAAAYVVIAYLSGMRDSEVKHLRRGCTSFERDTSGRIGRHRVTSQAFKGEGTPAGVEATWIVGAPVVRAIEVLEELHGPGQRRLFAIPRVSPHFHRTSQRAKASSSTNDDLRHLAGWITDYCTAHGRPDVIPLVSGHRWILRTSQFRRTLAWFIARRPGGSIAGAIQYRHLSVQMFEGYAGTSRSGFRAEAQQEQALARGEQLAAMVEGHEHHRLHGPAAAEAAERLKKFGDRIRFMGSTPDEAQMRKLMEREDPRIYPGTYVTCNDNPGRRLCMPSTDTSASPSLGDCKPLTCKNVALTPANVEAWQAHLARLEDRIEHGRALAPLVLDAIGRRRDDITGYLAKHDPNCTATEAS